MLIPLLALSWAITLFSVFRLYQWNRTLTRSKVVIGYKNRPAMQPTLLELLQYSITLQRNGRDGAKQIYRNGHFSVLVVKPLPRSHGKTKQHTLPADQVSKAKTPPRDERKLGIGSRSPATEVAHRPDGPSMDIPMETKT